MVCAAIFDLILIYTRPNGLCQDRVLLKAGVLGVKLWTMVSLSRGAGETLDKRRGLSLHGHPLDSLR